jgi:hypothetical protein
VGVILLYMSLLELAPNQYLFADLFVVLPLVSTLPSMEALPRLKRGKPEGNLVSAPVLCSVLGHALLIILFQVAQQYMLINQPWCVTFLSCLYVCLSVRLSMCHAARHATKINRIPGSALHLFVSS